MIFAALSDSDRNTFNEIYHKYINLVLYIAKQYLQDEELSKDAAQETFIRVFKSFDKFTNDDCNKLKTWITIIAKNVAINIYNKRKREHGVIEYMDSDIMSEIFESPDYDLFKGLTIKELTDEVYNVIQTLDNDYKDVILLRYYIGFNNDEIAKMLNIDSNNVRVRLHRARKMVQERFKKCVALR